MPTKEITKTVKVKKSEQDQTLTREKPLKDKIEPKVIVSLRKINKFYGKKHVLKDVSFDIRQGDRISFIGGNGSGKSTTMEIVAKVREASSGEVIYDPNLILGIQFQESNYPLGITVKSLIDFYLTRYERKLPKEKLDQYLKDFRLDKLYKKQLFEMSGGQKQRLNILLAIIHNPDFLILDELSTGLDIKVRREARRYVLKYLDDHPNTSLVLVTHSMNEAEEMTNRVIVLDWGVVKYDLPMSEIQKKYHSLDNFANIVFEEMYQENPNRTEEEDHE